MKGEYPYATRLSAAARRSPPSSLLPLAPKVARRSRRTPRAGRAIIPSSPVRPDRPGRAALLRYPRSCYEYWFR